MIESEPLEFDRRYFSPLGEHGVVERVPSHCPVGHPLGADTVLVAAHPCLCAGAVHRIWRCWSCDSVWVRPPCVHNPDWVPWLGRTRAFRYGG